MMRTIVTSKCRLAVLLVICAACFIAGSVIAADKAFADNNGRPVVVSMGDSYSSGEGTEPFIDQNREDKGLSRDWLAHRSEKAWPGLLEVDGKLCSGPDVDWYFVAASGAKTNNILGTTDKETGDKKGKQKKKYSYSPSPFSHYEGESNLPCQLDVFDKMPEGAVDYVTLTMGGNDVNFQWIVTVANENDTEYLVDGNLENELMNAVMTFDEHTQDDLVAVYELVANRAGKQAQVIVADYPHLFPKEGRGIDAGSALKSWAATTFKGVGVSEEDSRLISEAVDVFDEGISEAVDTANKTVGNRISFVDVRPEFNGNEEKYINPVYIYLKEQDLDHSQENSNDDSVHPSAYSVHPNEEGQKAYARAVQKAIESLEKKAVSQRAKPAVDIRSNIAMSLVFDVSGSMDDASALSGMTKLESAKKQSEDFVSSIQGRGGPGGVSIKVGVTSFANYAQLACGLSNNPDDVNESIENLKANGRTNMYAGLEEGLAQLDTDDNAKLLVLLSDGISNEGRSRSDILDLARQAASNGIQICTIGFGSSNDLDEALLKEIAEITGGEYSHEDSSDLKSAAVGLYAAMMKSGLGSSFDILMSETGSVGQGQTVSVSTFDVTKNGTIQAYLYWPGSTLQLQLTDPSGTVLSSGYAGYSIDDTSIPTSITITNAEIGTWKAEVYGQEVSMADEPFYAVAAFEEVPATTSVGNAGSGTASNNAEGLLFFLIAAAIACIVGVYAFTKRKGTS